MEGSILYQSYTLAPGRTDVEEISSIKNILNRTKTNIDQYQIQATRKELVKLYGTCNKKKLMNLSDIPCDLREQIQTEFNYSKLTSYICPTDFK